MATGARVRWYGSAGLLVVAGVVVIVLSDTVTAEAVSIALVSLGLIVIVSLMFFEVGLSEDRAREREEELRRAQAPPPPAPDDPRRLVPSRRRRRRG
jgi:membrane protein implicated in regulation of membrane protease activity